MYATIEHIESNVFLLPSYFNEKQYIQYTKSHNHDTNNIFIPLSIITSWYDLLYVHHQLPTYFYHYR